MTDKRTSFDFFEHQAFNRRMSSRLLVGFALVVAVIVLAINLVVLAVMSFDSRYQVARGEPFTVLGVPWWVLILVSLVSAGIVLGPAWRRLGELRQGGDWLMVSLGAREIRGECGDALERRFRNVSEEMAIAAGVPAPALFVLDKEPAVNALSAGYGCADACLLVTRGALDNLSRAELQAVVAHEFSHILNGDMRLSMYMIAVVYALVNLRESGVEYIRSDQRGLLPGVFMIVLGSIGAVAARVLKFAICRQRELLADASAVQFTRDPDSLAGALKRVAISPGAGELSFRTEQYGHMFFVAAMAQTLLPTHPPLQARIRRLQPDFSSLDLTVTQQLLEREARRRAEAESGSALGLMAAIGHPAFSQLALAGNWLARIPTSLQRAAHNTERVTALVLFLLTRRGGGALADEGTLSSYFGEETMLVVNIYRERHQSLEEELLLPLLEISLPAVRRLPQGNRRRLREWINARIFESRWDDDATAFLLNELVLRQIEEIQMGEGVQLHGKASLNDRSNNVEDLLLFIALQNHGAERAMEIAAGIMQKLALSPRAVSPAGDLWRFRVNSALDSLVALAPDAKLKLLEAMLEVVEASRRLTEARIAMVRLICVCLHIPLGPLAEEEPDSKVA